MPTLIPHAKLAALLGQTTVVSSSETVGALLEEIRQRVSPGDWETAKRATILVNGRNIHHMKGMKTPLEAKDEVWMVVPSGGG